MECPMSRIPEHLLWLWVRPDVGIAALCGEEWSIESRGLPIKDIYVDGFVLGDQWCIIYLLVTKLHHSYNTLQNHTWIYLRCIIYIDLPVYVHAYMNTYTWWFSMFEIIDPIWNHGPSALWKRMIEHRFWSKKTWLRLSSRDALQT